MTTTNDTPAPRTDAKAFFATDANADTTCPQLVVTHDFARTLETLLRNLLKSSDASWYEQNLGHDWRDAVDAAERFLRG